MRSQRDTVSLRLKSVFQAVYEAVQLVGAERRARNLPSPSAPNPFVDLDLNGLPPTSSRECAASIQRIKSARQSQAEDGLPLAIAELRGRIRDRLALQKREDDDVARALTERAERESAERQALKRSHDAAVAKYAVQDAEAAAKAVSEGPLTAEELTLAAVSA